MRNIAQCLECGEIIESKYRHDYITCKCRNLSVDGGKDYCKRSFRTENWKNLTKAEIRKHDLLGKPLNDGDIIRGK